MKTALYIQVIFFLKKKIKGMNYNSLKKLTTNKLNTCKRETMICFCSAPHPGQHAFSGNLSSFEAFFKMV